MSLTVSNLRVIDVSHYQTSAQVAAALPTIDGLIGKATEGLTSADIAGLGHVATARAAGKAVGFYHFGWLGSNVGAQVSWFLATAKPQPGDVLALDCEAYSKPQPGQWLSSSGARLSWVLAFVAGVNKATGARCWLYANRSELTALRNAATAAGRLKEFDAVPKWVADPDHPAGHPDVVGAWVCHQYSTAGGIDRDYFAGDYHSWTTLGVAGLAVAPKFPPAALYPGAPLGWKSTGAPVSTLQRSFRQAATGRWSADLSLAVNAWYAHHRWAKFMDRTGPGGVGRWGYRGIVRDYPKG